VRRESDAAEATVSSEATEQIAMLLLRRYGVVFRRLLSREPAWLPPWFQLLRAYRRLEAQGHIRGGRFVAGVSGEQYALADAVGALRAVRKRALDGAYVSLSAADPLNLVGIVTPGARVAALAEHSAEEWAAMRAVHVHGDAHLRGGAGNLRARGADVPGYVNENGTRAEVDDGSVRNSVGEPCS